MPATFCGVSEYGRNFRWVDGSLAATCGAPVAGKPSAAMQSACDPPIQRKSRAASPLRSSVVLEHPMSSERRSLAQDDFLLLGRSGKFEQSQPYRNSQKNPEQSQSYHHTKKNLGQSQPYRHTQKNLGQSQPHRNAQSLGQSQPYRHTQKKPKIKEAWSGGEEMARPGYKTRNLREPEQASDSSFQVTPDAPRNGALRSCATQTALSPAGASPRAARRRFASEYRVAFGPASSGGPAAVAAVVAANRLRNRGTHFSRQHFSQILGEGSAAWLPTPDTPLAPWRRAEPEEEEEYEEGEYEEYEEYEEEPARPVAPLRVPPEVAGRLPTPRAAAFRRHHLDRTTPAVGGSLLTAPASARPSARSPRGRVVRLELPVAGQPSADAFELLDETDDRDRAVRFAPDRTYLVARTLNSQRSDVPTFGCDSDCCTSSRASVASSRDARRNGARSKLA